VYGNDLSATAGMAVAQEAGLRLPDALSVVGFDDVPLASWTSPPLTTCRANPASWGRAAAQALVELIEHDTTADVELDPATLVIRGSTGPAPVRGGR
jgi:DNA-binding LacI/PurR family transcriptional regulator